MKKVPIKEVVAWDTLLIVSTCLCAFIIPVFPVSWGKAPLTIGFTLIFISGVMTMEKRNWYMVYFTLAAFFLQWISIIFSWELIMLISKSLNVIFFLIVIFSLIREMATAKIVTAKVIMSSISGYLLLGIIYSVVIVAIVQRDPDAFNFANIGTARFDPISDLSSSMYYGFVTLATLGYGDLLPLKPYSRSLASLICISGQLYIATIIGILIGKFASKDHHK